MTSPAIKLIIYCLVTGTWSAIAPFPGNIIKPGQCPSDVDYPNCEITNPVVKVGCKTDQHCEGKEKCCYSGCLYRCLLPLQEKTGSCPYFNAKQCIHIRPLPDECHNDQQCQGSERCCCFNCRRQCTKTVKVKPGQCPAQPKTCPFEGPELSFDLLKPPRRCKTDVDCPGNQKCCDFCGMRCLPPIKEHSGFCPVSNEQISCVTLFERSCCTNDEDCKLNYKCCLVDNRMECVPALKEKNGVCPPSFVKCLPILLRGKCTTDLDCVGDKKCCAVRCFMECVDPIIIDSSAPSLPPPDEKPRTCPMVKTLVACKFPDPIGDCTTDGDCQKLQKCCDMGCGYRCVDV